MSIRGDGLVSVTGLLSVSGTSNLVGGVVMSSTVVAAGLLTALAGLHASSGGIRVMFIKQSAVYWIACFHMRTIVRSFVY